jgi:hypothetical protein
MTITLKHFVLLNKLSGTGEWLVDNERREPAISVVLDSINDDDSILLPPAADTAIKTRKELMDHEEPAFASPWHVVLVHLQGSVLDTQQMHFQQPD